MADTTARTFRLLGMLQDRPVWGAAELASRLEVSERSLRRDVDRLRGLGYPVEPVRGVGGGYRLGAGRRMPPLLLDGDEAVAVTVALREAAGGAVPAVAEASLAALRRLDTVLPPRLRTRAAALDAATDVVVTEQPTARTDTLLTLAGAISEHRCVAFGYRAADGTVSERHTEPYRLVVARGRWYLPAHDRDRDDWRTFRVDRVADEVREQARFSPREAPDPVAYVRDALERPWGGTAVRVRVHAAYAEVRPHVPRRAGELVARGEEGCEFTGEVEDPDLLLWRFAMLAERLDCAVELLEPDDWPETLARLTAGLDRLALSPRRPAAREGDDA